jgi:hypothetical protein
MTCGAVGVIRLAKILKTLEEVNHFQCEKETVEFIHGMLHVSKLSNEEIIKEVLEVHTVVESVTTK